MSIESQATFYYRNVCDYNSYIKSDLCLSQSVINGFSEFSNLLRTIYADWRSYEISTVESVKTKIGIMTDDLENYHNLTYTLDCLYAIATAGELCFEGENKYLKVDKALFKSIYKKSANFPFEMLEKYGFYFSCFKGDKEVSEYKRCDCFHVYYENGAWLIETIRFLAQLLSKQEKQKEMPKNVAFMLADYHFILTGKLNTNPLQDSIINTLGSSSKLWKNLVTVLQNECKLAVDLSFNPYVFPNKTVTFKHNKKTICKFEVGIERLNIRLPLSYEVAKELIAKRNTLPQSINDNINDFHCICCGKCENQRNIEIFEGVSLCNLSYSNFITEDSRCLRFIVTSEEEIDVVSNIIRQQTVF